MTFLDTIYKECSEEVGLNLRRAIGRAEATITRIIDVERATDLPDFLNKERRYTRVFLIEWTGLRKKYEREKTFLQRTDRNEVCDYEWGCPIMFAPGQFNMDLPMVLEEAAKVNKKTQFLVPSNYWLWPRPVPSLEGWTDLRSPDIPRNWSRDQQEFPADKWADGRRVEGVTRTPDQYVLTPSLATDCTN